MTKFGVGVGEEFPVDDRPQSESGSQEETHRCGRRGHRERHDAWHQFRDQMRSEWRARRRAFRESMGRAEGPDFVEALRRPHVQKVVIGGLALIGLAALLSLITPRR